MIDWIAVSPAVLASFLASLVEVVEAFTIVLAVGTVQGWRPALTGAAAALLLLAVVVAIFGPVLGAVPIHILQLVIGILLLLFGMRWLRKAVLRAAGRIALHDEDKIYARQTAQLEDAARRRAQQLDWLAGIASFKAVLLEGTEVVFIVIAVGAANGLIVPASLGALAAVVLVAVVGLFVHRPLARVPENTLKYAVGLLLTSYGIFWTGEGLGVDWPGADLALVAFAALLLATGLCVTAWLRRPAVAAS